MPTPDGRNPAPAVPDRKIGPYLLDVNHRDGGDHAQFFPSRGFTIEDPRPFISALPEHPTPDRFALARQTPYVTKYVYEGPMPMPDGSSPRVRPMRSSPRHRHPDGDPARMRTALAARAFVFAAGWAQAANKA